MKQFIHAKNGRFTYDGIYQDDKTWIFTSIHGDKRGGMSLQWKDIRYPISPSTLREVVSDVAGVLIPRNHTIIITPCYPEYIKKALKDELKDNKIKVAGDWRSSTKIVEMKNGSICAISERTFRKYYFRDIPENNLVRLVHVKDVK